MPIPPQATVIRFTYLLFENKVCHIINLFTLSLLYVKVYYQPSQWTYG